MFLTVHATVGAVLGQSISNPWIAFVLGFLSHFVLDAIPHGDGIIGNAPTKKGRLIRLFIAATIDGIILSLLLFFLFSSEMLLLSPSVMWAMIGAMLPDALQILPDFLDCLPLRLFRDVHHWCHVGTDESPLRNVRTPVPIGIAIQCLTLISMIQLLIA